MLRMPWRDVCHGAKAYRAAHWCGPLWSCRKGGTVTGNDSDLLWSVSLQWDTSACHCTVVGMIAIAGKPAPTPAAPPEWYGPSRRMGRRTCRSAGPAAVRVSAFRGRDGLSPHGCRQARSHTRSPTRVVQAFTAHAEAILPGRRTGPCGAGLPAMASAQPPWQACTDPCPASDTSPRPVNTDLDATAYSTTVRVALRNTRFSM